MTLDYRFFISNSFAGLGIQLGVYQAYIAQDVVNAWVGSLPLSCTAAKSVKKNVKEGTVSNQVVQP